MIFQWIFIAALVVAYAAKSTDAEKELIEPVELHFVCLEPEVKGHKSPILFIHGLGDDWTTWISVKGLVNKTGRMACAIDLRNHGDSPWNNRTDVASMTVDVNHLLDNYKVRKVNIIGHSLGGKVAVDFTLKNPDIVNSVVIEDMRPNGVTDQALKPIQKGLLVLRDALRNVPEGSTADEAKKAMHDYIKARREEGEDTGSVNEYTPYSYNVVCPNGKCQFKFNIEVLADAVQFPNEFFSESKGLYRGPSLFIYGEISPLDVGGDRENIVRLFPDAQLVEVKNAGHSIHGLFREFEDEVAELLNNLAC